MYGRSKQRMMKVVNLKQAILQAWKERWSDYQWAINIKKNFPKGATWDYLNLAGKPKENANYLTVVLPFVLCTWTYTLFMYCRGPDGAGDDWSFSQPPYFVLSQICYKFSGKVDRNLTVQCSQTVTILFCNLLNVTFFLDGVLFQCTDSHQQGNACFV